MDETTHVVANPSYELCHHGIKGQRWGIRRFQKKDGSLTKAGQKRYNKEMEELKDEKKVLRNKMRTQKKMDKMAKLKSEVDDLKKETGQEESTEAKRARLLKSTDPKELYEDRDVLTTAELNERINRIDTEARLSSKIIEEHQKTGMEIVNEKMNNASNMLNNATNMFRKVDEAYSTVSKSAIGKTLMKQLGLEAPKKEFNITEMWEKRNKLSDEDLKKVAQRVKSEADLKRNMDTLTGKGNGKNNSGMSESDVEELVNRLLDERENNK